MSGKHAKPRGAGKASDGKADGKAMAKATVKGAPVAARAPDAPVQLAGSRPGGGVPVRVDPEMVNPATASA